MKSFMNLILADSSLLTRRLPVLGQARERVAASRGSHGAGLLTAARTARHLVSVSCG
jgi:hypothetical protein